MKRRHFSALAAASLGPGLARNAAAQGTPVAGHEFSAITGVAPVTTPPGTVEVVEFFSFACPHCFEFEPTLDEWLARKPAGVRFRRSPISFLLNAVNFQPMYFALEAMGAAETMAPKVFNAVHVQRQRLDKPEDIAAFMAKNGVDATRFMALFTSFGVRAKVQQATALMDDYGISHGIGVPALAVQGRWITSPAQAKGAKQALAVVDYLVAQVRAGH